MISTETEGFCWAQRQGRKKKEIVYVFQYIYFSGNERAIDPEVPVEEGKVEPWERLVIVKEKKKKKEHYAGVLLLLCLLVSAAHGGAASWREGETTLLFSTHTHIHIHTPVIYPSFT